ncbi:FG-GAP repeat domain-containing protein [Streptomyces sp. NPDC056144]|uniref:FG-GAP repeat domain-containing protein n=1 Tax=unclassified Streptomyces TaxID=2593676 RepID=UPI0035DE5D33
MSRTSRTYRFRLAAALAATASLTVGTLATVPAATAATATESGTAAFVAPFPKGDAVITSAGPKGFSTRQYSGTSYVARWTRYSDGATTVLPSGQYHVDVQTDIVPEILGQGVYAMHDMSTGAVTQLDVSSLGYTVAGFVGPDILMKKTTTTGGTELHAVGMRAGVLVDDVVTGLPEDAAIAKVFLEGPTTVVVSYSGTVDGVQRKRAAVVDITGRTVVEEYDLPATFEGFMDLSSTHISWLEKPTDTTFTVAVIPRKTTTAPTIARYSLGQLREPVYPKLVGEWLTYMQCGRMAGDACPLNARSLTTGETITLLEDMKHSVTDPTGALMVRGGTAAQGEGLYRIDPSNGATRPAVTQVARTGEPSSMELVSYSVPSTIDADKLTGPVTMSWQLSRTGSSKTVVLTHKATQRKWSLSLFLSGGLYKGQWTALSGVDHKSTPPAPNGDYTWHLTATPDNKIGPVLEKSGTFKVVRRTVPHDFNDNGTPDLLSVERDGSLLLHNTPTPLGSGWDNSSTAIGISGWRAYDRLLTPGNVGGTAYPDVVARDKTGVLWLHQGTGRAFSTRTKIGGGWNAYTQLTAGGDFTDNGKPDLLAVDKTGGLWLYKGTGDTTRPFTSPTKIGTGYNTYNKIVATGNIAGGPAGDLVGRDKDGVLWLHQGTGRGGFSTRTKISGGWNANSAIIGIGDLDRDGRNDLATISTTSNEAYFHKGTGDWRAPFKAGTRVYYDHGYWGEPAF